MEVGLQAAPRFVVRASAVLNLRKALVRARRQEVRPFALHRARQEARGRGRSGGGGLKIVLGKEIKSRDHLCTIESGRTMTVARNPSIRL